MPKLKTHRGAAKRFKITGGGKIKRRMAFGNHLLEKKSQKQKRNYANPQDLGSGDKKNIKKLLGL